MFADIVLAIVLSMVLFSNPDFLAVRLLPLRIAAMPLFLKASSFSGGWLLSGYYIKKKGRGNEQTGT
jgi:hypothetical protein